MCTSLFPLAWSARSPWRVLVSIEACSGLMPPPADRISPRFLRSASLNGDRSIATLPRHALGGRRAGTGRTKPAASKTHLNSLRVDPPPLQALSVAANQVAEAAEHAAE